GESHAQAQNVVTLVRALVVHRAQLGIELGRAKVIRGAGLYRPGVVDGAGGTVLLHILIDQGGRQRAAAVTQVQAHVASVGGGIPSLEGCRNAEAQAPERGAGVGHRVVPTRVARGGATGEVVADAG